MKKVEAVISPYRFWLEQYPTLGSLTNHWDDADGDGMENLVEYALGGVPTNSDAAAVFPEFENRDGWLYYVYRRRSDPAAAGLEYRVEASFDLISEPFTNATVEIGSGPIADSGFHLVTNGMQTISPAGFMCLRVQEKE